MNTKQSPKQSNEKTGTGKTPKKPEELKTEPPISEKDEVKQAEERTNKARKKG
jgi:hypothetical protein